MLIEAIGDEVPEVHVHGAGDLDVEAAQQLARLIDSAAAQLEVILGA